MSHALAAIPVFYGEELLANSDSRSPSAGKPKPVVEAWQRAGLPIELRHVAPATLAELSLAHDPDFVQAILLGEAENGFGNCRPDVARALPYTTGALLNAAEAALECGIACAPVSGFHHAEYATAQMFCTFNGLVVAARKLLNAQRVERVLILDLDFHYGNGTEDIIERLGLEQQIENMTFGRWYVSTTQAAKYLEHLNRVVGTFGDYDLILYQAGADLHVDDPLGGVLDSAQMRERDRMVFEGAHGAAVPLAWDLAGGYQEPLSKVLAIHMATMEECVRVYCD
jgi:acetoin utilization deacetylase AcuC-like enzyme